MDIISFAIIKPPVLAKTIEYISRPISRNKLYYNSALNTKIYIEICIDL